MRPYAVIETGGKQYLVREGMLLDVEKLEAEPGQTIQLDRVLAVSDGKSLRIGRPTVSGAAVKAEVVKVFRGEKLVVFKKKRRKGYHKKAGHRQTLMRLKIQSIQA